MRLVGLILIRFRQEISVLGIDSCLQHTVQNGETLRCDGPVKPAAFPESGQEKNKRAHYLRHRVVLNLIMLPYRMCVCVWLCFDIFLTRVLVRPRLIEGKIYMHNAAPSHSAALDTRFAL